MTGFEPGSSGIGSDRSANCAITTAQWLSIVTKQFDLIKNIEFSGILIWIVSVESRAH